MDRIKQLEEIAEKWLQIRYKENIQKIEEQYHLHKTRSGSELYRYK